MAPRKTKRAAPRSIVPAAPLKPIPVTEFDRYSGEQVDITVKRIVDAARAATRDVTHALHQLENAAAAGDLLGISMACKNLLFLTELGYEARVMHQFAQLRHGRQRIVEEEAARSAAAVEPAQMLVTAETANCWCSKSYCTKRHPGQAL